MWWGGKEIVKGLKDYVVYILKSINLISEIGQYFGTRTSE